MVRKIHTPERIIGMLREFEVRLAQGEKAGAICRSLSISEQGYYRCRREYGGLKLDQAKRLKVLERENGRHRRTTLEATPGIEPGCADLQSAASPLRHVASSVRARRDPNGDRRLSYRLQTIQLNKGY